MNTEQIEKVIESIAKSGYTPERKTHIDKHISLDYGCCKFTLNYKGDQLIVGVTIQINHYTTFDQGDLIFDVRWQTLANFGDATQYEYVTMEEFLSNN